jgi:hypothetical protein
MFETARAYTESFAVYGQRRSFEWQQLENEDPILFTMESRQGRGSLVTAERIAPPDRVDLLPPAIARFTQSGVYDASTPIVHSCKGGHGGSHPHLVRGSCAASSRSGHRRSTP